jgi:hypothetical protein
MAGYKKQAAAYTTDGNAFSPIAMHLPQCQESRMQLTYQGTSPGQNLGYHHFSV